MLGVSHQGNLMNLPNSSQVAAFGRHIVTYSAGAVSAAALMNIINPADAGTINNSITQISQGVAQIAAGLAPLVAIASGLYASWTASHTSQIAAVKQIPGVVVVAAPSAK